MNEEIDSDPTQHQFEPPEDAGSYYWDAFMEYIYENNLALDDERVDSLWDIWVTAVSCVDNRI